MAEAKIVITTKEINDFIASFNKTDFSQLQFEKYKVVDFIGFDAFKVVGSLLKKAAEEKISMEDLKDDIIWMLVICLKKGSVTKNNKDKMSEEGKKQVDRLMTKYGMQFAAGKGATPELITFTRVLAAFPIAALSIMSHIGSRPVPAGPFGSAVVPSFMQHQVFASVIPRQINSQVISFIKTLVLAYSCDTSSVSSTNRMGVIKTEDLSKIASQQVTFVNAAFLAAYPGEAARLKYVTNLEWKTIYNKKTIALYESMCLTYFKDFPTLDWTVVDAEGSKIFKGVLNESGDV